MRVYLVHVGAGEAGVAAEAGLDRVVENFIAEAVGVGAARA